MSNVQFVLAGSTASGKTLLWNVERTVVDSKNMVLGKVKWFSPWRKYVFLPASETLFDAGCLEIIVHWCNDQTLTHWQQLAGEKKKEGG